jgi:hypothetical protein
VIVASPEIQAGSFRDPSGFVFERCGDLYRQVNPPYSENYRSLVESGLLEELWSSGLLVAHSEVGLDCRMSAEAIAVLRPERIKTISYPYEWCFGQLKDAALCTLEIQKRALARGMSLKDASAYNIQFAKGKPIFIDTLSFERYEEGKPWIAYRQFCSHFLAPLALMAHVDIRLQALLKTYLDGVPLDLASALLPGKTKFSPGLAMHLHMHAKAQASGSKGGEAKTPQISKTAQLGIVDSLESAIRKLEWTPDGTVWANYYQETNYSESSFSEKHKIVSSMLGLVEGSSKTCWDLGANSGEFSRLAIRQGFETVAFDFDPAAVEKAYRDVKQIGETQLLPLLQDLTNPSPSLGWSGRERDSLAMRGPADVLLALALVHHLAIGNNVPLKMIAQSFAELGRWLIVEFVAKDDSQVVRMLSSREDVFPGYVVEEFEAAFADRFELISKTPIESMARTLFLYRRRD